MIGATERNKCASVNAGQLPTHCRPAPCGSCDSVPCGYCQEGCPASACTYESEVDKPGAQTRNECPTINGVMNAGEIPFKCRPAPCASCDSVPCGFCQEGCPPSACDMMTGVDKVGAVSRNECPTVGGVLNAAALPTKCRAGTIPTSIVTVAMSIRWDYFVENGPVPTLDQDALIVIFQTEVEAMYSSLSLTFTTPEIEETGSGVFETIMGIDYEYLNSEISATAQTNDPVAFSAIAHTILKQNIRDAVDISLVSTGGEQLVRTVGDAYTAVAKLASVEEDNGDGGKLMATGAIIGVALGAVAIAGVVGAIAYREWTSRQIPIDDVSPGDQSNPVSNRVNVCLSDVDACLSAAAAVSSRWTIACEENKCNRTRSLPMQSHSQSHSHSLSLSAAATV